MRSDSIHYFSFNDNGIVIDQKFRDKVFEIFQRLHTSDEYAGTGIGLTICKKIVEQLGGKIAIQTNKYGESSFNISIPV